MESSSEQDDVSPGCVSGRCVANGTIINSIFEKKISVILNIAVK